MSLFMGKVLIYIPEQIFIFFLPKNEIIWKIYWFFEFAICSTNYVVNDGN